MEKCASRWKKKLKIVLRLFIIVLLTISSQATGQHVIPVKRASESSRSISSPNKEAYADIFFDSKIIKVGTVEWSGNIGRTKLLWSMKGDFRQGWITDNGEYFVGCSEDLNFLPKNFSKDLTVLSFFKHGSLITSVKLDQLITDFTKLEKSGTQYRWCKYIGLNECGFIALETTEGKKILLDVPTGKAEEFKPEGAPMGPGWKRYEDITRCYQFQYPRTYSLKESVVQKGDKEGFPTGYMVLVKDGKRSVEGSYENVRAFRDFSPASTFEQFAAKRAEVMCGADGPDGSIYAKGTARKKSFTNPHGLSVLELYFTVVQESYGEDMKKTEFIKGPVFAVCLSYHAGTYPYGVLFFRLFEGEGKDAALHKEALRKVIDTVRLLKAGE